MYNNKKSYVKYSLNLTQSKHIIRFGKFAIKSLSFGRLNTIQIISIERFLIQKLKSITSNGRYYKMWNLMFFNLNLTKLSPESRMGKGKGFIYTKAIFLSPGSILFEFSGLTDYQMLETLKFIEKKVSFKLALVKKIDP